MTNLIEYKEGSNIKFLIKKHIELSENEKYFVLEDKNGRKHLLKSDLYKKYNLKIGDNISCKIDHINCAGKIFLEPKHPFYNEGEIYSFKIHKIEIIKNRLGKDVILLSFTDKLNNIATCKIENKKISDFKINEQINCRVELIKKGQLYLSFINPDNERNIKIGKYYNFIIVDVKVLRDGFKYYILEDKIQQTHLLRYEFYENYNFIIGKKIKCQILKFSSEGYYILEPKHPYYEIGKIYNFSFIKQLKDTTNNYTGNYEIIVKDIFDKEIIFTSNKKVSLNNIFSDKIKCKVIGIKKGKPLLLLLQ